MAMAMDMKEHGYRHVYMFLRVYIIYSKKKQKPATVLTATAKETNNNSSSSNKEPSVQPFWNRTQRVSCEHVVNY